MGHRYKFHYPLRVRYVETDAQGHVFFGHYLTYFDVGLTEYIRAIGYAYPDMLATGMDMFYVEANCQYKGRAYFDDLLHVHTRIGHIGNTSFTFEFAIYRALSASALSNTDLATGEQTAEAREAQSKDDLIATGRIVAVTVDTKTEQPVRVPDELREAVARYEGDTSSI